MNKKDLYEILRKLSEGYIKNEVSGKIYAYTTESLIAVNLDLVPDLEDFADFLAQYSPNQDLPELYNDKDLKKKIKIVFKLK